MNKKVYKTRSKKKTSNIYSSSKSKLSPKSFLWEKLYDDIVPLQKKITPKPKKVSQDNFEMPEYKNYEFILKKNYNVSQLKVICKKYKQRVSGNKNQLKFLLYNFLRYSYFAKKIQNCFKKYLINKINTCKGPALFNRVKCVNETDFLTLEKISDICYEQFISYKDKSGFIYGFNISSIYNLYKQKKVCNPYNRSKFPEDLKLKVKQIYKIGKLLNMPSNIDFNNVEEDISHEKKIKFKTIDLFNQIDQHGFITNIEWFLNLNRIKLCKLIKEIMDVWNYRLQIPIVQKMKICPMVNPFDGFRQQLYINKPFHILQNKILKILKNFITMGVDDESKRLGCYYVLGSLTLVSVSAADACPWLYGAFQY